MRNIWIIAKRELAAYFATPVAFVFIVLGFPRQAAQASDFCFRVRPE
mgnify:CR=1 FL=1